MITNTTSQRSREVKKERNEEFRSSEGMGVCFLETLGDSLTLLDLILLTTETKMPLPPPLWLSISPLSSTPSPSNPSLSLLSLSVTHYLALSPPPYSLSLHLWLSPSLSLMHLFISPQARLSHWSTMMPLVLIPKKTNEQLLCFQLSLQPHIKRRKYNEQSSTRHYRQP